MHVGASVSARPRSRGCIRRQHRSPPDFTWRPDKKQPRAGVPKRQKSLCLTKPLWEHRKWPIVRKEVCRARASPRHSARCGQDGPSQSRRVTRDRGRPGSADASSVRPPAHQTLYRHPGTSRTELARRTGLLSRQTVSGLVKELCRTGVVQEDDDVGVVRERETPAVRRSSCRSSPKRRSPRVWTSAISTSAAPRTRTVAVSSRPAAVAMPMTMPWTPRTRDAGRAG